MTKDSHDVKIVVLRKNLTDENTVDIVEQKKMNIFKSFLTRPKKESIHIHSIKLCYECIIMISGKYVADYFKKATHTISVDSNVREIALKDGTLMNHGFPEDLNCLEEINNYPSRITCATLPWSTAIELLK